MRTKSGSFFEVGVRYDKTMEDGQQKKVTERYVIDALSFTEAEERIANEMSHYISGEYEIKSEVPAAYGEIFLTDNPKADKYYKVKVAFISVDEKNGKEKRSVNTYLVQGSSVKNALDNTNEVFKGTVIDYVITAINETKILDFFEHKSETKENANGDKEEATAD